jgi:hypothetical protein
MTAEEFGAIYEILQSQQRRAVRVPMFLFPFSALIRLWARLKGGSIPFPPRHH